MYKVLYYSMTGNTKKLAMAIADEIGAEAESIKSLTTLPDAEVVFLGSGNYGNKPGEDMSKFIEKNDLSGRKFALFGTSGSGEGNEVRAMSEALRQKGAVVLGSYYCKGRAFLVINMGHPGKEDLEGVRKFAREMIKSN
ncbi:flavodoxin [Methanocella sp. CWC-04]|uniref:Flavodoxin n=1 Tax=Methanooceanicella nereidis TaxID=2052831 RepID=A0AAP2RG01_9EURY|nr:flavodoxin family protein [Methanocella sp. CWC-04]MCD1295532.1 flavodoxin [Methanocella sp. CWC-04]